MYSSFLTSSHTHISDVQARKAKEITVRSCITRQKPFSNSRQNAFYYCHLAPRQLFRSNYCAQEF